MMLTCSAPRAPLTNRVEVDNSKFPEDVLLEIFDAYRQLHELQPRYEYVWNSRNGWFKLTHVCRSWRRLVHLSPSRLHVHLLFTPPRLTMLRHLPPFPILVDYSNLSGTDEEANLMVAAIMHRSRVRGITLRISDMHMAKFLEALSHPFPELESLDICHEYHHELILPAAFLSGSAPCLRRLVLGNVVPNSLSPLLSSATSLVDLSLTIEHMSLLETSLLTNLRCMSRLRHLELNLNHRLNYFDPQPPAVTGDVVPLSKLTDLIFTGHIFYLEALVVGLAAPSLQRLLVHAELSGQSPQAHISPIPHLCKFIRDAGCRFTAVRLNHSFSSGLNFYASTSFQSVYDQPFIISLNEHVSLEQMGQELSGPLSTVEELIIMQPVDPWYADHEPQRNQWRGFCYHLPQVKIVRVPARMSFEIARSLQQDGLEPVLDILPALQAVDVEVSKKGGGRHIESARSAFKPLMDAREREGRPIRLGFLE